MPWSAGSFSRDNGTHQGATTWAQDRDNSDKITAANHDTHDQDISDGINATLTKDGTNSPSASLPMGTNRHTGVGDAAAKTDYAAAGQIIDGDLLYVTATGTDTYAATLTVSPGAYAAGQVFFLEVTNANTGAATLNVNALGAKAITKNGTTALVAGDIPAGSMCAFGYDGTQFQLMNTFTPVITGDLDFGGFSVSKSSLTKASDDTVSTTTTKTFNFNDGGVQKVTFSGAVTITLAVSNFPSSKGSGIVIDAVNWGVITAVTIPAGWKFEGGAAPAFTAAGTDRLVLYRDGDDTYNLHVVALDVKTV